MFEVFEWLGSVYSFYRASQDAGMWLLEAEYFKAFLESFQPVKE